MADADQNKSLMKPRNVYWLVVTAASGGLVLSRRSVISPGNLTLFDQGLLVFFAVLILLPLAAEFEAFGFKLRRELQGVKQELASRIEVLQAAVQTSIGVRSDVNVTVPLVAPDQLQRLEDAIRRGREPAAPAQPEGPEARVPPDARFLFAVRYLLEQALDDALPGMDARFNQRHRVRTLMREGYLKSEDVQAFDQVWSIASRAVHGETVEHSYVAFVRDTSPYLLAALAQIRNAVEDDG